MVQSALQLAAAASAGAQRFAGGQAPALKLPAQLDAFAINQVSLRTCCSPRPAESWPLIRNLHATDIVVVVVVGVVGRLGLRLAQTKR